MIIALAIYVLVASVGVGSLAAFVIWNLNNVLLRSGRSKIQLDAVGWHVTGKKELRESEGVHAFYVLSWILTLLYLILRQLGGGTVVEGVSAILFGVAVYAIVCGAMLHQKGLGAFGLKHAVSTPKLLAVYVALYVLALWFLIPVFV